MRIRATVLKASEKAFKVMLGEHEIGVSKTEFDAQFHVNAINNALELEYNRGYDQGDSDGYENGRSTGYDDGYDEGYQVGKDDAEAGNQ